MNPLDPIPVAFVKSVPTHVWLFLCCVLLMAAYYIRPDNVTEDLVKSFCGALLLSLRTGNDQRPPPPNPVTP